MGTGTFASIITGDEPFPSAIGVYPIIAWRRNNRIVYAAEVSDLFSGATVDYGVTAGFYRFQGSDIFEIRINYLLTYFYVPI